MVKHISLVETAKIIRGELKAYFPGIKFSVRSQNGMTWNSISIKWIDGPTESHINSIVSLFKGKRFDAYTDSSEWIYGEWEGEEIHFGSDYINCQRITSRVFVEKIVRQFCDRHGLDHDTFQIKGNDSYAWIPNTTGYSAGSALPSLLDLIRSTDARDVDRVYNPRHSKFYWQDDADAVVKAKAQQKKKAPEKESFQKKQEEWQKKVDPEEEEFQSWLKLNDAELRRIWRNHKAAKAAREEKERQEAARKAEEAARKAREEAKRAWEEAARRARDDVAKKESPEQEQARKERERQRKAGFFTREDALNYLSLPSTASKEEIMTAFRKLAYSAADGHGGYTRDMDKLVLAKKRALA